MPAALKVFRACTSAVIQLVSASFCPKADRLDRARALLLFWTRRPFLIAARLLEAPVDRVLVHLGATDFFADTHQEDIGFLAAANLPDHIVDDSILDEWREASRYFHGAH